MKKNLLLTLMWIVAVSANMSAQEVQTSEPVINLYMKVVPHEEEFYYDPLGKNFEKYCSQHYYLVADIINTDENSATIYYRISRYGETSEWYECNGDSLPIEDVISFDEIEAYAQVEGKLPSEICHAQYDFNGDTDYELLAIFYYIDGLYFIQPYSYLNSSSVAFSNSNPWIGGPFNDSWDYNEPSNYSGEIVVPDHVQWYYGNPLT